jgi:hypothetical protein
MCAAAVEPDVHADAKSASPDLSGLPASIGERILLFMRLRVLVATVLSGETLHPFTPHYFIRGVQSGSSLLM